MLFRSDETALTAIARLANGGMRDSQSILDQVISFSGKTITEADVLSIYGLASAQQVADLARAIATGDGRQILALCDAFHAEGRDLLRVLGDLQARVRQASLDAVRQNGTSALLGAPLATEQLVRVLECLQAGEQGIRQGLSPRANFEVTLLKAIEQSRARSIDLLIKDIAAASAGLPREPGEKKINRYLVPPVNLFGDKPAPVVTPAAAVNAAPVPAPASRREAPGPSVDVPLEETPFFEESLPPLDIAGAEEEAEQAVARSAFAFPAMALPVSQVAETGKSSFPGDKEFQDALAALPPGLAEKLRSTLGAEFTALRPVPAGKLRRPV